MIVNYNENPQYLIHFPGKSSKVQEYVFKLIKDNKIKKSDKLSIVLCANKKCLDNSNILYQLNLNNISFYNSDEAYNTTNWNNILKCKWILQSLKQVNTEYSLVCDVRDVIITNNLDESLLSKIDHDIIFNASRYKYPEIDFDDERYNNTNTKYPYFNAGLCIGKTEKLIELYSELEKIHFNDYSEQANLRKLLTSNKTFDIYVDSYRKIFSANHENDCIIKVNNDSSLILIDDIEKDDISIETKLFGKNQLIVLNDLSEKTLEKYNELDLKEHHYIMYKTDNTNDILKLNQLNFKDKVILFSKEIINLKFKSIIEKQNALWVTYKRMISKKKTIRFSSNI